MKTLASVCGLLVIAAGALSVPAPRRQAPGPTVPENIVALLKKRCVDCHSGSKPAESLNLEPDRILAASLDRPAVGDPARKLIDEKLPFGQGQGRPRHPGQPDAGPPSPSPGTGDRAPPRLDLVPQGNGPLAEPSTAQAAAKPAQAGVMFRFFDREDEKSGPGLKGLSRRPVISGRRPAWPRHWLISGPCSPGASARPAY